MHKQKTKPLGAKTNKMKKDTYKNLKTTELLKNQKNLKIRTIALVVIAALLLGVEIYLLFEKDEVDSYVYFIGVLVPLLAIWTGNIEENRTKIKAELKSR